jgi:hypothetical protein
LESVALFATGFQFGAGSDAPAAGSIGVEGSLPSAGLHWPFQCKQRGTCKDCQLVTKHATYSAITPETWAEYGRKMARRKQQSRNGDFYYPPYKDLR